MTEPLVRDRDSGELIPEPVYGDSWLRLAYGNPLGRAAVWLLAARPWFSKWYGKRMDRPASARRIASFVHQYGVDMSDYAKSAEDFQSFNDFFSRELAEGARSVDEDESVAVFPADGRHRGWAKAKDAPLFYLKGEQFSLHRFIGAGEEAERFQNGAAVVSRLCPIDYHRFHFPVSGVATEHDWVRGPLYSVNPLAERLVPDVYVRNRRWPCRVESERFGRVLVVPVGATCVGTIALGSWSLRSTPPEVGKGAEMGYFSFGGSAVMTLFEEGKVELADDLLAATEEGEELYAKMGTPLAVAVG